MTSDTTTKAPNKILVKQFTSKSNNPTYHTKHVSNKWSMYVQCVGPTNFIKLIDKIQLLNQNQKAK